MPVDVVDPVAVGVVVRVEGDTGPSAPKPRLHLGFLLRRTSGRAADRHPRGQKRAVVGGAGKRHVGGTYPGQVEVAGQGPLDAGRPGGHLAGRDTGVGLPGLVAVVGEEAGVGRAEHVEVEVERDVVELVAVQPPYIIRRPFQTHLFGSPEGEPHGVGGLRLRSQRDRGFQHRRHARAVVIDTGALGRTVQVRAHHDDVAAIPSLCLRQDVS